MAKDGQELNAQKKIVQFNIDPQIDENALYQQKLKNYNTEDFARLLDRQDRMVNDLSDRNDQGAQADRLKKQGDLDLTKAELDEIDKLLQLSAQGKLEAYTTLTQQEIAGYTNQLQFKRTMDIAQLLINEHSKSDSKEMQDVKEDLLSLAVEMERMNSVPVSKEALCELSAKFALSLRSITNYLTVKKPFFSKGKNRYAKVTEMQGALLLVRNALDIVSSDISKYEGKTIGSLLGMRESRQGDLTRAKEEKQNAGRLSRDGAFVANLFRADYNFCAVFSNLSERKRRKESAKVAELKNILSSFAPDQTMVRDVKIMGKKVRLLQKADNRLYIIENHKEFLLDQSALSMCNAIEANMLQNVSAYNNDDVNSVLDSYQNVSTSDEVSRSRQNLIDGLAKQLNIKRKDFTNELRKSLVYYTRSIVNGTMTVEEVREAILKNDSVSTMINGVEMTEMMEQEEGRQEEINKRVSMYEIANEAEQNDWSKEERSVRNLMAEFVYTTDTQIMDSNVATPHEFVRTVLLQNTKAFALLLKEGGGENDIIDNIFKKMSLDEITDENENSFERSIASAIRTLRDYVRTRIDTTGSPEEIEKAVSDLFKNKDDADLTRQLTTANSAMEEGINASCEILQKKVTKMSESIFTKTKEEKGKETLDDILKNATRGEKGQGLFTRKVFENYFRISSTLDKRAMLASVLRNSKKVTVNEVSDEELINEIKSRKLDGYDSVLFVERNYRQTPLTNEDRQLLNQYRAKRKNEQKEGQQELTDEALLDELKQQKPKGYEQLYYMDRKLSGNDLSDEARKLLDKYRAEKKGLSVGANYLGGLIRGAGPLFQKMMQGLPEDSLPPELRMALFDVKSNLPPMPERVVKSQINAMIERSGKQVDRIEIQKSLGAASVGQTFLCKMYGPKFKDGKTVVIKLLRSDVQNRMMREKKVMLDCAGMVDEGMRQTYEGQLGIYFNELDLVKEAENIKAGNVYNNRYADVESEKINETIPPTTNSLVLDEAPGKTLDSILLTAEKDRQDMMHEVLSQSKNEDGSVTYYSKVKFDRKNFELTKKIRNNMIDKISELIHQRDIMANICKSWVDEALFKSGYFHADLHAGNIMISNEKGTLIDYGNAVTFTAQQQAAITRMMGAASGAVAPGDDDLDVFFNSFTSLLDLENDPDLQKIYDKNKQTELKAEFKKILDMGTTSDGGQRIAAALLKAQELGIKLPSAVYNFSQGQLRLQRSINDINDMISKYKEDINKIDSATSGTIDAVDYVQKQVETGINEGRLAKDVFKSYMDIFEPVDKETFIKELLDNEFKEEKEEKGERGINRRADFDSKYLDGVSDFKDSILRDMGYKPPLDEEDYYEVDEDGFIADEEVIEKIPIKLVDGVPDFSIMRKEWALFKETVNKLDKNAEDYKEKYNKAERRFSNVMTAGQNYGESCYKMFGGMMKLSAGVSNAIADMDDVAMDEIITVYEKYIPIRMKLEDKIKELRKKQDQKKLKDDEKALLTEEIYRLYNELHEYQAKDNIIGNYFLTRIKNYSGKEVFRDQLSGMFEEETKTIVKTENGEEKEVSLGALFKEQFDSYMEQAYKERNVGKDKENPVELYGLREDLDVETKKELLKKERAMLETYTKIATLQLKRFYEGRFDRQPDIKSFDFMKVMKDVLCDNINETMARMGINVFLRVAVVGAINAAKMMGKDPLEAMFNAMSGQNG
ncbi:MAG: hypothetical protein IJI65_00125 [Lachnospiraceae bacterium]|nr:hypothetical protein [Lachnospiraceae bacterium]